VAGDGSGHAVSSAGDINGDGLDDLIVGAYGANPNGIDSGNQIQHKIYLSCCHLDQHTQHPQSNHPSHRH
jgi:hypothetical protein